MMWDEKDDILMGASNDYDLSSLASAQGPQENERMGTVSFMALDLLIAENQGGDIKHMYHRELESFIWVLVWVCLRHKDGTLPTFKRPFDDCVIKDAVVVCMVVAIQALRCQRVPSWLGMCTTVFLASL